MKNFKLHRIKHPGRINLPKLGTINLSSISDELAQKLYDNGLPFLKPIERINTPLSPEDDPDLDAEFLTGSQNDTLPV